MMHTLITAVGVIVVVVLWDLFILVAAQVAADRLLNKEHNDD